MRELDWAADTESLLEAVGPVDCVLATGKGVNSQHLLRISNM